MTILDTIAPVAPPADIPEQFVVGRLRLRITSPTGDGTAFADDSCRRGEIRTFPTWCAEPSDPMPIAKARPILTLMGISFDDARQNGRAA